MGKHNRIKVQPQYGLELIWSPLAELRNKSRMSENVIELKKPNIFREIDCTVPLETRATRAFTKPPSFMDNPPVLFHFKWILTSALSAYW